ncbi:hypothetical protein D3C86_1063590 [compost metagenome]
MSGVKHTPGPWKIDFGHPRGNPCGISAKNDGRLVTRFGVFARPSTPEALANARLIAAAPDLLAAADAAMLFYDAIGDDHRPGECKVLDDLARAIAMATGTATYATTKLDGYEAEGGVNNSSLPPQSEGAR